MSRLVKNPKHITAITIPSKPDIYQFALQCHSLTKNSENGRFKCEISIASRMKRVAEFFLKHDRQVNLVTEDKTSYATVLNCDTVN